MYVIHTYLMETQKIKEKFVRILRPNSVRQYISVLRRFGIWLDDTGLTGEEKTEDLIQEFTEYNVETRSWKESSVSVARAALITYFRKIEHREVNKDMLMPAGETSDYEPILLTRDQVGTLFSTIRKRWPHEMQTMANVAWEAALRTGEIVTLKDEYFKLEEKTLISPVLKTWDRRTGKYKMKKVYLSDVTIEAVRRYVEREHGNYTFLNKIKPRPFRKVDKYPYRRWLQGEWSSAVGDLAERLFGYSREEHPRIAHNIFRDTRLTHLAEDTKNFLTVLQTSGHKEPRVALKYFERAGIYVPEMEVLGKKRWGW